MQPVEERAEAHRAAELNDRPAEREWIDSAEHRHFSPVRSGGAPDRTAASYVDGLKADCTPFRSAAFKALKLAPHAVTRLADIPGSAP